MEKIKSFISSNAVLVIAFTAAVISMFFIPPSAAYKDYIDFHVLIMLFCLMGVVEAFREIGVFKAVTSFLLNKTSSSRMIAFIMMNLCFFTSMLVTNDVALITFVPLCIGIGSYTQNKQFVIRTIVIETAAANLGSMMTPIGNPHNLFVYSYYKIPGIEFFTTLLPAGILSYALLCLSLLLIKKEKISYHHEETGKISVPKILIYAAVFVVCLLAVAGIVNEYICLGVTALILLLTDRRVFTKIDYSLLATFVCFFVFVGNLGAADAVREFVSKIMEGREMVVSALLSQVISNVPASIMLSGFTENAKALLIGVNIGGLGTPVASLASLISFRLYSADKSSKKGKYMGFFLIYSFIFFAVLMLFQLFVIGI
ncbi:MAG: citrate transporter [Oscillospiraceae bacterium]|nr:citrate transporter [Oscillospiraceae bacterium]